MCECVSLLNIKRKEILNLIHALPWNIKIYVTKAKFVFLYLLVYIFVALLVCPAPSGQTKNGTDLKFCIHPPLDQS